MKRTSSQPAIQSQTDAAVLEDVKEEPITDVFRDGNDSTAVDMDNVTKRGKFEGVFRRSHEHDNIDDEALADHIDEYLSVEERRSRELKRKIPTDAQVRFVIFGNWLNVLLLFVPTGFALRYTHSNPIAVFCVNFIAIIPSATILSNAANQLSLRTGEYVGALLNMTSG